MHTRAVLAGLWCVAGAHLAVSAADDPGTASPTTLVERLPATAGLSAEEVSETAEQLWTMGTNAIPVLVAHLDDGRPVTNRFAFPVKGNVDVGFVSWWLLRRIVEYKDHGHITSAFLCRDSDHLRLWWKERQNWSLADLQVEAACCSLVMADRNGNSNVVKRCLNRLQDLNVTNIDERKRQYGSILDKVILEDVDKAFSELKKGSNALSSQSTNIPYIILRFRIESPEGIELESLPPADGDLKKLRGAGTTPGKK